MGDELVGKNGSVGFDFDEVDGHGWDFSEDDAADGVGEGEVDVGEFEVDAEVVVLWIGLAKSWFEAHEAVRRRDEAEVGAYVGDLDLWSDGDVDVHALIHIHIGVL